MWWHIFEIQQIQTIINNCYQQSPLKFKCANSKSWIIMKSKIAHEKSFNPRRSCSITARLYVHLLRLWLFCKRSPYSTIIIMIIIHMKCGKRGELTFSNYEFFFLLSVRLCSLLCLDCNFYMSSSMSGVHVVFSVCLTLVCV